MSHKLISSNAEPYGADGLQLKVYLTYACGRCGEVMVLLRIAERLKGKNDFVLNAHGMPPKCNCPRKTKRRLQ